MIYMRKTRLYIAGLKDGKGSQPRNVGSIQKLEKTRKQISQSLRKEHSPELLDFSQDPFWTFDLQWDVPNIHKFDLSYPVCGNMLQQQQKTNTKICQGLHLIQIAKDNL